MSDILECVEAVKTCSKCGETKPVSKFRSRGRTCLDCYRTYDKAYHANPKAKERKRERDKAYCANPKAKERKRERDKAYCANPKVKERKREYDKAYLKQSHGRASRLLSNARKRSKEKGLPFDLTLEWLKPKIDIGVCEMTGIPFDMGKPPEGTTTNPNAPSIDQIIPSAGYTMDNCRVVIWAYNKDKGDMSDHETIERYKNVLENNGSVIVSANNPFAMLVKIFNPRSYNTEAKSHAKKRVSDLAAVAEMS